MTTKAKPAVKKAVTKAKAAKPYVATQGDINLAASAGLNMRNGESAKQAVEKAVAELRAHKAVIGDARNCPLAQAFLDKRYPMGKGLDGKAVSKGSMANALSAFRDAVNNGKAYDENKGRKTSAAKGKAKGARAGGSGNILISISKAAKPIKAAESLLKGFNAMKKTDSLSGLAAFLIDAIEEAKIKGFNPLAE